MERILPTRHERQQGGARKALLDRSGRCGRLHDPRTAAAALLGADVPRHCKGDSLRLQHLRLIGLAEGLELTAIRTHALLGLDPVFDALEVLG